ncbi:putative Zn-binding protein involved in type VI secretion [Yoonia maricola]|uniref:Putative Zn-binding protein involved in type VI secretion n=1 Tax=Yoonia maricola TaxID=420999 RepID=A0A2M8WJT1_9RHOB|nr:putative Zn-binding protein involved in type VI secretion [Yoonia maricola]
MKPIARIGDTHICPAHGPNPIVSTTSSSTCTGRAIAVVGDKTACGAVITTGTPLFKINGKPAAHIGSLTNHGGTIASGAPSLKG